MKQTTKNLLIWTPLITLLLVAAGAMAFWRPVPPAAPEKIESSVQRVEGSVIQPRDKPDPEKEP